MIKQLRLLIFSSFCSLLITTNALADNKYEVATAEQERIEKLQQEFSKLSEPEQKERVKKANSAAAIGTVLFRAGEHKKASEKFEEAIQLNPNETRFYFQHGLSLIKNDQFKKGIYYVGWDTSSQPITKYFHIGLAYFRLGDYESTRKILEPVVKSKDERYSPLAAYYLGLADYQEKKYEAAKGNFEFVLDNSKDSELDAKAESYIEKILRAQLAKKKQSKRYSVSGLLGLQYDSNILFTPDAVRDQGNSLGDGGLRYLAAGQFKAKVVNKEKHELAARLNAFYMLSAEDRFERADPLLLGAHLPYTFRGKALGEVMKLTVSPGYETLFLDANTDNEREQILRSPLIDTTATFIPRKTWISSYQLKLRKDDSLLSATGDDDADAFKIQLFTNQTFVLNKTKSKTVGARGGITSNSADGKNNDYYRLDLSGFYATKLPWHELSWLSNLGLYRLNYTERSDNRQDTNISLGTSLSKPLKKWLKLSLLLNYTKNFSNVDASEYDKFTALTALSFDHAF